MENPHEAEQAVILERIIKNVVSRKSSLYCDCQTLSVEIRELTAIGQVQRGRSRDEPFYPSE